jgi:hypothetical protein
MPDLKISQLTNGDPAQTADQIPINRAGVNFSITAGSVGDLAFPTDVYSGTSAVIITDATTARTLSATDNGKVLYFTSNSSIAVTFPTGLGAGFSCVIIQAGFGQITVSAGSGATIAAYSNLTKTAGQYAIVTLISPVADTAILGGNITV